MTKTLLSILVGIVVAGSASAVPTPDDRRALCERHSDKYVWVQNTGACVSINPCKSDDYTIKDAYCVDIFDNVQTHGDLYLGLVELYARAHNLKCEPLRQEAKSIGQDYGMCLGEDFRVFEFDDINDSNALKSSDFFVDLVSGLCAAVDGYYDPNDDLCKSVRVEDCDMIRETIKKYPAEFTGDGRYLVDAEYFQSVAACRMLNPVKTDK